jgi:hypothetical protein
LVGKSKIGLRFKLISRNLYVKESWRVFYSNLLPWDYLWCWLRNLLSKFNKLDILVIIIYILLGFKRVIFNCCLLNPFICLFFSLIWITHWKLGWTYIFNFIIKSNKNNILIGRTNLVACTIYSDIIPNCTIFRWSAMKFSINKLWIFIWTITTC